MSPLSGGREIAPTTQGLIDDVHLRMPAEPLIESGSGRCLTGLLGA